MNDIAEKLLAAISEREDFAQIKDADGISDPDSWHTRSCGYRQGEWIEPCECDVPAEILRRCAADREIVDHFRHLVAKYRQLKSSARESLDEDIELRTVEARIADFAAIILPALARGYGIQP